MTLQEKNIPREQKIIINSWQELVSFAKTNEPEQKLFILETISQLIRLRRFNLDNDKEDYNEVNTFEYTYERLAGYLQNQDDLIELILMGRTFIRELEEQKKQVVSRDKEKEEKRINKLETIQKNLANLLEKSIKRLGIKGETLDKLYSCSETKQKIKVYIQNHDAKVAKEAEEKVRKEEEEENQKKSLKERVVGFLKFPKKSEEYIDENLERTRWLLGFAYQNRARKVLNDVDSIFGGSFEYINNECDIIKEQFYYSEIEKTLDNGLWKSVKKSLPQLDSDPGNLYKYLKIIPFQVRKNLYKDYEEEKEFYDQVTKTNEIITSEELKQWKELIDRNLKEEQIIELFHLPLQQEKQTLLPKPKKAELIAQLQALGEKQGRLKLEKQNLRNDYEAIINLLISQMKYWEDEAKKLLDEVEYWKNSSQEWEIYSRHILSDYASNKQGLKTKLRKLGEKYVELKSTYEQYYNWSQVEIDKWKTDAETHLEALGTSEEWNKTKFDKTKTQKDDLIRTIREKNNELEDQGKKIENLQEENQELINKIAELQETNTDYQTHLDHAHQDIEEKSQELKILENDFWEVKDKLDDQIEETEKWFIKYQRERERFIYHDARLAEETKQAREFKRKYEDLEQENKELRRENKKYQKTKIRLGEQVNNLHRLEESKNEAITKLNLKLSRKEAEINDKQSKIEDLEWKLQVKTEKWNRARQKLRAIKHNQKKLKAKAQNKEVSMSLIKWEEISNRYLEDNDNSLVKAVDNTSNNLIDKIIEVQQYLGVPDLTQITTTHPMPVGKTLTDLIDFFNNSPTTTAPSQTTYIEIPKEIEVEVEKPVIKKIDKIVEIESEEQRIKIKQLKQVVTQLEEKLKNQPDKTIYQQNKLAKWWWLLIVLLIMKGLVVIGLAVKLGKMNKIRNKVKKLR